MLPASAHTLHSHRFPKRKKGRKEARRKEGIKNKEQKVLSQLITTNSKLWFRVRGARIAKPAESLHPSPGQDAHTSPKVLPEARKTVANTGVTD